MPEKAPLNAVRTKQGFLTAIYQYGDISGEDAVIKPYENLTVFGAEVSVPDHANSGARPRMPAACLK